jgi:hypothetical protein
VNLDICGLILNGESIGNAAEGVTLHDDPFMGCGHGVEMAFQN